MLLLTGKRFLSEYVGSTYLMGRYTYVYVTYVPNFWPLFCVRAYRYARLYCSGEKKLASLHNWWKGTTDSNWREDYDYRRMNSCSWQDTHYLPTIHIGARQWPLTTVQWPRSPISPERTIQFRDVLLVYFVWFYNGLHSAAYLSLVRTLSLSICIFTYVCM